MPPTLTPRLTRRTSAAPLVTAYRSSEPHGWPVGPGQELGVTIGGHEPSRNFAHVGRGFRISLLAFGQGGDGPHTVYEAGATDPQLNFGRALVERFGGLYYYT